MKKITAKNAQETFNLGLKFAKKLNGGEVLALCGDLGAGKTKFIQGLAKGLGVNGRVNSPTFNILKIYQTKSAAKSIKALCHIDAYRLSSGEDLIALGVKEFFTQPEVVTAVEWAEKVKEILPKETIVIKIKHREENKREILIS